MELSPRRHGRKADMHQGGHRGFGGESARRGAAEGSANLLRNVPVREQRLEPGLGCDNGRHDGPFVLSRGGPRRVGNGAGRTARPPSPRVNEGGRDVGTGRIGPRARWSRVRGMEPEKCTFPKMTLASATGLCPWPALLGTGGGLLGQDPHQPLGFVTLPFSSSSLPPDHSSWSQEATSTRETGTRMLPL